MNTLLTLAGVGLAILAPVLVYRSCQKSQERYEQRQQRRRAQLDRRQVIRESQCPSLN